MSSQTVPDVAVPSPPQAVPGPARRRQRRLLVVPLLAVLLAALLQPDAGAADRDLRLSDPRGDVVVTGTSGGEQGVDVVRVTVDAGSTTLRVEVETAAPLPSGAAGLQVVLADGPRADTADRAWFVEALRGRAAHVELLQHTGHRASTRGWCDDVPPLSVQGRTTVLHLPVACFVDAPDQDLWLAVQAVQLLDSGRSAHRHDAVPDAAADGGPMAGPVRPGVQGRPAPVARIVVDSCGTRPSSFPDVPDDGVHHAGIACIERHDITRGRTDGTFGPSGRVTHGQVAAFLVRTLEAAGEPLPMPLSRRCGQGLFADDADRLVAAGIADASACDAERVITRARMAAWTAGAIAHAGRDAAATVGWYGDVQRSAHGRGPDDVTSLGVVTGVRPGVFAPDADLTRGEMATFLARTLDAVLDAG